MLRLITVCASVFLYVAASAASADTPPDARAAAPSPATTSTPAAVISPTSAAAAPNQPTDKGGLTDADIARAFAKYRKTHRNGTIEYCRVEKPLGTRIGKSVCLTEDQVLARARAERDAPRLLSQRGLCTSANAACVSP